MSAFGENLRREREMRGVSLAEISQATKIGARLLDAIETERFDRLPGGVFNAAFVRQYARYLGLDEDRAVAEFDAAFGASSAAIPKQVTSYEESTDWSSALPLLIAVIVLVIGASAFMGWKMWRTSHPAAAAQAPAPAVVQAPPPVPASQPAPVSEPAIKGLELELDARDRCNIQVSVDGADAWDAVMRRGTHRNLKAERTVKLTVDNAAALRVTRNGELLPALGGKNETQTVTFKAGNP